MLKQHVAVICFMHIVLSCKIYFISIEQKCPVISVFEYFLLFFFCFVLVLYVQVNSYGHVGGGGGQFT